MSSREVTVPTRTTEPEQQADARTRATVASVLSFLLGLAPALITVITLVLGPALPYPAGALISFVLVAVCIALALIFGIRGLILVREAVAQIPPVRRGVFSAEAAGKAHRGLNALRILAIAGIAQGGLHGLFLLGSLALTIPGIIWLMSIAH